MGTIIQRTSVMFRYPETLVGRVYKRVSGAWVETPNIRRFSGGSEIGRYSTPDVNCSGGGANTSSGASSSGTASVQLFATPGGSYWSLNYSWSYVSGDTGVYLSSTTAQNPVANRDFSGVANGTTSSGVSAVWQCTVTDPETGAETYSQVSIGALAWQNTIPAFGPFTASGGGFDGSDFSGGGAGHTITKPWSGQSAPISISGGPTSGSFSYAWHLDSDTHGSTAAFDNSALEQPTISDSFIIPEDDSVTDTVTCHCVITDTVSGYSYTLSGVTFTFEYTNNTG